MGRAQGIEGDAELGGGDFEIAGGGKGALEEGAALLLSAAVVGSEEAEQITLGLVGDHLEQVGEVLAFDGELDDVGVDDFLDRDAGGQLGTLGFELGDPPHRLAQAGGERGVGDLESAHGGPPALPVVEGGEAVVGLELLEVGAGLA